MKATILSTLITKLRNLIMMIRLHRRFSMRAIPVLAEKRILVPDAYKKRH